jgi:hypothetical protein
MGFDIWGAALGPTSRGFRGGLARVFRSSRRGCLHRGVFGAVWRGFFVHLGGGCLHERVFRAVWRGFSFI